MPENPLTCVVIYRYHPSLSSDLLDIIAATTVPMPADNPAGILDIVCEERLRLQYMAELAYLRGDFALSMRCFQKTQDDDAAMLRACPVYIATAISLGDYRTYRQIEDYLKQCIENYYGSDIAAMAELTLSAAAVSVIAPGMAAEWLRIGDFDAIPLRLRPYALYLRAKYFQCIGCKEAMLAVSQTALTLCDTKNFFTTTDLYLRLCCSIAFHALGQEDMARHWLLSAMDMALPHGFVTPFSEVVTSLGGLVEKCLINSYPHLYDTVIHQWKRTFKNWTVFHNQFTNDNLTLILSLREYHIAQLLVSRVPYVEIAKQHCISPGRLKNIKQDIYGKLYISDRKELSKYVFGAVKK